MIISNKNDNLDIESQIEISKLVRFRQKDFQRCMKMAVKMIETGALDISGFWSKGYERETEWQDAFKEGNQRMPGYNRGYIEWL